MECLVSGEIYFQIQTDYKTANKTFVTSDFFPAHFHLIGHPPYLELQQSWLYRQKDSSLDFSLILFANNFDNLTHCVGVPNWALQMVRYWLRTTK